MKKILVTIDDSHHSESAINYAIEMCKRENSLLVGVYVQDLIYENVRVSSRDMGQNYIEYPFSSRVSVDMKVIKGERESNYKDKFIQQCNAAGIQYKIHPEDGILSMELVAESMYADLIVAGINGYVEYRNNGKTKSVFLREILKTAYCPVMIVPEEFTGIERVVLAYDGETSSMQAIKNFCYLFPELAQRKGVSMISVAKSNDEQIVDEELVKEYLKAHFPDVSVHKSTGKPEAAIVEYCNDIGNPLLVLGSFGRGPFSELIKPSVGEEILRKVEFPVFVSHV